MMPSLPEPTTRADMIARKAMADARMYAAAERHQTQKRAREAEEARSQAEARAELTTRIERTLADAKAQTDAAVYSVLDPEKVARSPRRIIARVAENHGISAADITGPSRKAAIVHARWEAIAAVAAEHRRLTLPALGRIFGDRDHTSILHALRKTYGKDYRHLTAEPGCDDCGATMGRE